MDVAGRSHVLREALTEPLRALGVDLQTLDLSTVGRRRVLRVGVARDVAHLPADDHTSVVEPLTLDEVAEATRAVSATLDEEPASTALGDAPYTLEVGSVGVSTPLSEPSHFRRNVGRLVRLHPTVSTADGGSEKAKPGTVTGRLLAVTPETVTLLVPGTPDGVEQRFGWADIDRGVVQVEFTRPRPS